MKLSNFQGLLPLDPNQGFDQDLLGDRGGYSTLRTLIELDTPKLTVYAYCF